MGLLNALFLLIFGSGLYSITHAESLQEKYNRKFDEKCFQKFPIISELNQRMSIPRDQYFVYSFYESQYKKSGGLGDRVAGLLSSIVYSLQHNRTLLILGDKAFCSAFQPYQAADSSSSPRRWDDWSWSGWKQEYMRNALVLHCLNPKPSNTKCALLGNMTQYRTIKYRSNRAFVCLWLKRFLLSESIGHHLEHDTFALSGCLLRLVMQPTQLLWLHAQKYLDSQLGEAAMTSSFQLGFHFRCGDASMVSSTLLSRCVYNASLPWEGTSLIDSISYESPVDMATCGNTLLIEQTGGAYAYIASDHPASATQIAQHLNTSLAIVPLDACHLESSRTNKLCMFATIVQWLLLSLSDVLIVQATTAPLGKTPLGKTPLGKTSEGIAPSSAFSKYAAMFGLLGNSSLRYAGQCAPVNTFDLGLRDSGNWLCDSIS